MNAMITAMCFEGTLNGQVFLFFLEHFLCPLLRPGHIVIMDNAKAHLVEGVRELIESKGARLLYLPPYSPDYNPIELAWSKIKHSLRKARARTVDALYQAISQALDTITSDNAIGFFNPSLTPLPELLLKMATYDFEKWGVALQVRCLMLKEGIRPSFS